MGAASVKPGRVSAASAARISRLRPRTNAPARPGTQPTAFGYSQQRLRWPANRRRRANQRLATRLWIRQDAPVDARCVWFVE